jgi:hypothetical protein
MPPIVPKPSSGIKKRGSIKSGTPQCTWTISNDGKGLLNGTLKTFLNAESGSPADSQLAVPKRGDRHPFSELLYCVDSSTNFSSGDIAYNDANYVGLESDPCHIQWTLNCPTEETDIQFHPKFAVKGEKGFDIIETEATEDIPTVFKQKEVIIDPKTGAFESFAFSKENGPTGKKKLYGVKSFKDPRITFNISYKTQKVEYWTWAIKFIKCSIDAVPLGPSWTRISGKDDKRTWLLIDTNVTEETGIYNVSLQFALSGDNGWNELMYEKFSATVSNPAAGGAQGGS